MPGMGHWHFIVSRAQAMGTLFSGLLLRAHIPPHVRAATCFKTLSEPDFFGSQFVNDSSTNLQARNKSRFSASSKSYHFAYLCCFVLPLVVHLWAANGEHPLFSTTILDWISVTPLTELVPSDLEHVVLRRVALSRKVAILSFKTIV